MGIKRLGFENAYISELIKKSMYRLIFAVSKAAQGPKEINFGWRGVCLLSSLWARILNDIL